MLKGLRSMLAPSFADLGPIVTGYEAIGDEEEVIPEPRKRAEEKGVYWSFWLLGAGVLLSWNALICTIPLLASLFPATSSTRANLASWLSTVYSFGNLFFLGAAQRNVGKTSPSPRLHRSLLLLLGLSLILTFPLLPLLLPFLASTSSPLLLPLLIVVTLLLALSTAYLQSSVFAFATLRGSTEMLAVMSGQVGIAVLVSGAQMILAVISAIRSTSVGGDTEQSTLAGVGLWALGSAGAFACMIAHQYLFRHPEYSIVLAPILSRANIDSDDEEQHVRGVTTRVFWQNIQLEAAVAWVFVVTLSIYPPITTAILSVHSPAPKLLQPAVFIPLHFVLFNIGDYAGRTYLPAFRPLLIASHIGVLLLSLSRTLFIPLFLLCNVVPRPADSLHPLINSDTAYFLILLAFGLSNGYISSLSMILASSPSLNPAIADEEKDIAGTLAAFCLVAGLAGGSVCSFGVNWVVRGNVFG